MGMWPLLVAFSQEQIDATEARHSSSYLTIGVGVTLAANTKGDKWPNMSEWAKDLQGTISFDIGRFRGSIGHEFVQVAYIYTFHPRAAAIIPCSVPVPLSREVIILLLPVRSSLPRYELKCSVDYPSCEQGISVHIALFSQSCCSFLTAFQHFPQNPHKCPIFQCSRHSLLIPKLSIDLLGRTVRALFNPDIYAKSRRQSLLKPYPYA